MDRNHTQTQTEAARRARNNQSVRVRGSVPLKGYLNLCKHETTPTKRLTNERTNLSSRFGWHRGHPIFHCLSIACADTLKQALTFGSNREDKSLTTSNGLVELRARNGQRATFVFNQELRANAIATGSVVVVVRSMAVIQDEARRRSSLEEGGEESEKQ